GQTIKPAVIDRRYSKRPLPDISTCPRADPQRRSWFGLPVVDERDGRGRAFFGGEIHQESLAIGRHRVFLLIPPGQWAAGNANREQRRRSSGFQRLFIR